MPRVFGSTSLSVCQIGHRGALDRSGQSNMAPRAPTRVHGEADQATSDREPGPMPRRAQPIAAGPDLGASASPDVVATVTALRVSPTRTNPSDFITFAQRMSIPTGVAVRHSKRRYVHQNANADRPDRAPRRSTLPRTAVSEQKSNVPPEIFAPHGDKC